MSSKMSSKRQIKRSKEKRNQDKMDKAMNDVKKIGIISCCLIAILLVIGIFISPKESYAAGFLQQLPDSFKSGMSDEGKALISDIYLPNEFYGVTSSGERLSFIYCMDRRLGMIGNHTYVKGNSVKTASVLDGSSDNRTSDYPGLIYILQNDEPTSDSSTNYYITQLAVWWYIDRANGFDDNQNYTSYDLSSKTTSEDGKFDGGNYKFYNNLSAADKDAIEADSTYGQYVVKLVQGAVDNENNYLVNNGNQDVIVDENNISYTMTNDYIETSVIKPTSSNTSFESYSVQINSSVGTVEIVDENNNPIASDNINASQGFKLRVPIADVQSENFKVNITIVGYFADLYDAFIYNPSPTYEEVSVGVVDQGTCASENPGKDCYADESACTNAGGVLNPETKMCDVRTELQRALLGLIERPSTPITFDLEAPTLNVPDTASTSYLVYGIGALVIIAGILLIVVAKRPKNAKKK